VYVFNAVYIEIEDLLHQFNDPNVVDIKMGTRSVTSCVMPRLHDQAGSTSSLDELAIC